MKRRHSLQEISLHKELGVQKNMMYPKPGKQFCEAEILGFKADSFRDDTQKASWE